MDNTNFADTTLTMEELRGMVGEPVWMRMIGVPNAGRWVIVDFTDANTLYTKEGITYSNYGEYWLAYAYPPAYIDREKWEPCKECVSCENCQNNEDFDPYEGSYGECGQCCDNSKFKPKNFCYDCGRPLTPEAWAEFEKRVRG